ncbi:MAG TPA: hypothetical protein DER32_11100 [Deinococcus radiodurans]|nr:hypothetical protein [Deinococcus radiodurans]
MVEGQPVQGNSFVKCFRKASGSDIKRSVGHGNLELDMPFTTSPAPPAFPVARPVQAAAPRTLPPRPRSSGH